MRNGKAKPRYPQGLGPFGSSPSQEAGPHPHDTTFPGGVMVGTRVYDSIGDDFGTIVEVRRGRYRIDWDRATPHQAEVLIKIPNAWCDFARPAQFDGTMEP